MDISDQSENQERQQVQEESEEEEQEIRRSERVKKPVVRYGFDEFADISTTEAPHIAFNVSEIEEPTTIKQALNGNYAEQWKTAADAEYHSLMEMIHGN